MPTIVPFSEKCKERLAAIEKYTKQYTADYKGCINPLVDDLKYLLTEPECHCSAQLIARGAHEPGCLWAAWKAAVR